MPVLVLATIVLALLGIVVGRNITRSNGRRNRDSGRLTERLSDPREAAASLLVQQAAYDGHVSGEQKRNIRTMMAANFAVDAAEADALYAFGRMAVEQTGDVVPSIKRVVTAISNSCTPAEMHDLVGMLEQVGETGGPMTDRQRLLVVETRRVLGMAQSG